MEVKLLSPSCDGGKKKEEQRRKRVSKWPAPILQHASETEFKSNLYQLVSLSISEPNTHIHLHLSDLENLNFSTRCKYLFYYMLTWLLINIRTKRLIPHELYPRLTEFSKNHCVLYENYLWNIPSTPTGRLKMIMNKSIRIICMRKQCWQV